LAGSRMVPGVAGSAVAGRGVGAPGMEPFWNRAGGCAPSLASSARFQARHQPSMLASQPTTR
jgi:hypothetical protein